MSAQPWTAIRFPSRSAELAAEWAAGLEARLPLYLCEADPHAARHARFIKRGLEDYRVESVRRGCKPMAHRTPSPLETACTQAVRKIERRKRAEQRAADRASNVVPIHRAVRARRATTSTEVSAMSTTTSTTTRPPAASVGRQTGPGIAEQILAETGAPMHNRVLTCMVIDRAPAGLYSGKTPAATINAQLALHAKRENGVFVRTAPGCFGLRAWSPEQLAAPAVQTLDQQAEKVAPPAAPSKPRKAPAARKPRKPATPKKVAA